MKSTQVVALAAAFTVVVTFYSLSELHSISVANAVDQGFVTGVSPPPPQQSNSERRM